MKLSITQSDRCTIPRQKSLSNRNPIVFQGVLYEHQNFSSGIVLPPYNKEFIGLLDRTFKKLLYTL